MAIEKLSINDLLIDTVPGAPPPEATPNEKPRDPQQPDLTCTPDPTKAKAHRQVVGVENAGGKANGKATGLYNKHRKYSEQWDPWHPFQSAHDVQQAQSFSQQTKIWINQHLRHGLDNFKIDSFQSADALRNLLSELKFGLGDDSWIEDDSHIFGTLYYRDIFKCIQFLLAHLPFQAHLNSNPVRLTDSEGRRIYSKMNTGDWWWGTQDQFPAGATIVPVICASDKTNLTNFSCIQHAWPLYLTIGNIRKDMGHKPKKRAWILIGLIPCPPKGAKNIDKAWHSAVGTVLSQLRHLVIAGPGLKWVVQMDSSDNITRCWLPGLGIIWNKAWWLKSHQAHVRCEKFLKGCRCDIQLFDHSITEGTGIFTQSCWRTTILMLCTL